VPADVNLQLFLGMAIVIGLRPRRRPPRAYRAYRFGPCRVSKRPRRLACEITARSRSRTAARAATGILISARLPVPPLGATAITMMAAAMLGAVVAGAALALAILPPAHAAGEPGTLAFSFGSLGTDDGEFHNIRGIALAPDGKILVADHKNDRIQVFYPNGTFAFKFSVNDPTFIAAGPNGSIIARTQNVGCYLCVFYPNGTQDTAIRVVSNPRVFDVGPHGLALAGGFSVAVIDPSDMSMRSFSVPRSDVIDVAAGPGGIVAMTSRHAYSVQVFHPNGTPAFVVGSLGTDDGEFRTPSDVAFSPDGKIFVRDANLRRVQVFDPNGTFISKFEVNGGSVYETNVIHFGPRGEFVLGSKLYHPNGTFATDVRGGVSTFGPTGQIFGYYNSIRVYYGLDSASEWQPSSLFQASTDGTASGSGTGMPYVPPAPAPSLTAIVPAFEFGSYGEGPGEFLAPHNIAFGPGGIIAVSDAENNRIQLFHPNGTFALEVGSRGSGLGEFAGPHGLTFGPNGLLAVSDVGNHRVQVFRVQ